MRPRDRRLDEALLLALARAATPGGRTLGAPGPETIRGVHEIFEQLGPVAEWGYGRLLDTLDAAAVPLAGRRFSALEPEAQAALLAKAEVLGPAWWAALAATAPIKMARSRAASSFSEAKARRTLAVAREHERWMDQIFDPEDVDAALEADVVVVGTGAGGAPLARSLAREGLAVLILEAGPFVTREEFDGGAVSMGRKLFWDLPSSIALGNAAIPIPVGRCVGGTTTINSGTCFRTPDAILARWRAEGLDGFTPEAMERHFAEVEEVIGVAPTPATLLGGCARVIARGADALGYSHHALRRNAPGCDGQGVCFLGCPTDAKRSTNVSYIPQALASGAMLVHRTRVDSFLSEGTRITGVRATGRAKDGRPVPIEVRARAVVLAAGTIHSPSLLMQNGLGLGSGQIGKNLSIHPASYQWAELDESIRGWEEVPQGYGIDQFAAEGIRFEGGYPPLEIAGASFTELGRDWSDRIDALERLACFGFMIADRSRGRVFLDPKGKPRISYWLEDADRRRIVRGHSILARVFFAAGARVVRPGIFGVEDLRSMEDAERFERASFAAHRFALSAYHPLGTCRMGVDPARSVVGPDHALHGVSGLYVVDGSTVNGPLGVNPQVTIMAMSERAAAFVARGVEERLPARSRERGAEMIRFDETMSGEATKEGERAARPIEFRVRVSLPEGRGLMGLLRSRGARWGLAGELDFDGVAAAAPCEGALVMRPRAREGTLAYDLSFTGTDGARYLLHGEKDVSWRAPLSGMTTLHTEIRRDGELFARGVLRFHLGDLASWLSSFRVAASA